MSDGGAGEGGPWGLGEETIGAGPIHVWPSHSLRITLSRKDLTITRDSLTSMSMMRHLSCLPTVTSF